MYVRQVDGKTLSFVAPSTLWRNDLVMKDLESGSLWSHHSMKCILGPSLGKTLTLHPYVMTSWGRWRRAHPNSAILDKSDPRMPHSRLKEDNWEIYFKNPSLLGVVGEGNADPRLPGKTRVLCVSLGGEQTVYVPDKMPPRGVVNDVVGGQPILVVVEGPTSLVWSRRLAGQVITFERAGPDAVRDRESKSDWDLMTGRCIGGAHGGQQLEAVPSVTGFWFAWARHYPATRIWSEARAQSPSPSR